MESTESVAPQVRAPQLLALPVGLEAVAGERETSSKHEGPQGDVGLGVKSQGLGLG